MTTLTTKDVTAEIRKIAEERPDFKYGEQPMEHPETRTSNCSYVYASVGITEGEGCIVGQALQRLGFSEEQLLRHDTVYGSSVLVSLGLDESELNDYRWVDLVQSFQDTGESWGEAVRRTDASMTKGNW